MNVPPFYQIGWSDSHYRDIRLEYRPDISAPTFRLVRLFPNGEESYITLLTNEAVRLYNALGQQLQTFAKVEKSYKEPDHSGWHSDPIGSD